MVCLYLVNFKLLFKNKMPKLEKKRKREAEENNMEIVWQTPAIPPEKHDYIFRDGRRHVRPYYFEFISHVKNRWAGKTIVDLFAEEFKGRPYDYYVSAVKCGRIQVDGEMVPVSYIVKSSQKISHFLHRHEPPVMALGSFHSSERTGCTDCLQATVCPSKLAVRNDVCLFSCSAFIMRIDFGI
ncbi:hypothetical protein Patl1_01276 [Pistacia atlantica]|uniref:Uncharacterized protein n=1 Tax=Pistacia atlantica TaxID=434234 RepID=A0ACC1CAN4_9ROSI|nr:hypothetical protein Patl1_01276 [Pistacia atlantica]